METPPFASLAQLKILIIPIGPIRPSTFSHWATLIRSFPSIRLADIPPDPREDRARFLPSALSAGSVHLSFPSHPPPSTAQPYALFRPSQFVHGVLGIADCASASSLAALLAEFYGVLHQTFGPNPVFPLAGRCYAFDPGDADIDLDVGGALEGLTVIPTVVGDKRIYLGTLLANFCGQIIGEFAGLTRVLDTPQRLEELNRFLLPTLSTLDTESESGDRTPLSPVFASAYTNTSSSRINGSASLDQPRSESPAPSLPGLTRSETVPVLSLSSSSPPSTTSRLPNGRPLSSLGPGTGLGIHPLPSNPGPLAPSYPGRSASPLPPLPQRASTASPSSALQGFKARHTSLALSPPPSSSKKKPATSGAGLFSPPAARLSKLTADLYLLSGRLQDAVQWYTDSLPGLRSDREALWLAGALEGLAVASVLEHWGREGPPPPAPPSNSNDPPPEPWVEPLEKLTQAVSLYWRAAPLAPEDTSLYKFELLAITTLYCDSVVRLTRFLFSIWASGGWGDTAFNSMLTNSLPPLFLHPLGPSVAQMLRLSQQTGITRSQLANVAAQSHGPFLLTLLPVDRVKVLSFLASLYGWIGYGRKGAYVLRELQAGVVELLVGAREELSADKERFSILSAGGLGTEFPGSRGERERGEGQRDKERERDREREMNGGLAMRENERVDGNGAIVRLVRSVCSTYGISLDAVVIKEGPEDPLEPDEQRPEAKGSVRGFGNWEQYGWPELQVGVMREAISLVELLPDYPTVAQLALTAIRKLGRYLPASEQHHLYVVSMRAMATARRRGDPRRLKYWSESPLVGLEVVSLPAGRVATAHELSELEEKEDGEGEREVQVQAGVRKDPFLYNPRLQGAATAGGSGAAAGKGRAVVVQGEPVEFLVSVRNPHAFDFDLQSVALATSGVAFRTQASSVSLPAGGFQLLRMSGVPLEPGVLVLRGCTVQVNGCLPRTFLFALPTKEDDQRLEKRQLALEMDYEMIKDVGLDARPAVRSLKRRSALGLPMQEGEDTPLRFIECTVLPEQPMLRVKRTSLTHGAVMLYDGERSSLTLTLENMSPLRVNFLRVTFEDSTMAPSQALLAEGELDTARQYETEYDLVRRPVFRWDGAGGEVKVDGGKTVTVGLTCLGKAGCTSGTVQISYGCVPELPALAKGEEQQRDGQTQFFTRQILYPVLVTVYHNLECQAMDVLRFSPSDYLPGGREMEMNDIRRALLDLPKEGDWCLFTVDVRNLFGIPFEVTLERTQQDAPEGNTTQLVPPGTTLRLMLPLQRCYLPPTSTGEPIPSLLSRQFLAPKNRLSTLEEREQRLLFWYREKLFDCVKAGWREPVSGRRGELSLRGQRMTGRMVQAFRAERVKVELTVRGETGSEGEVVRKGGKWVVPANEFVYVRAKVTNLHWEQAHMTLSLSALPPTPTAFVLHDGSLFDLPLGPVAQGESVEKEVCMVFVAEGKFEWAATVRIWGEEEEAGRSELALVAVGS